MTKNEQGVWVCNLEGTIVIRKEALEQQVQEPVAWMDVSEYGTMVISAETKQKYDKDNAYKTPLYTHPHQDDLDRQYHVGFDDGYEARFMSESKSWQGLSNDMVRAIGEKCQEENRGILNWIDFYNAIERMLKDKNYDIR